MSCLACGYKVWDTPTPVAIWVQPVEHEFVPGRPVSTGLAIAQRAIQPHLGKWALLAGHIKKGESVESGGRREYAEETGLYAHDTDLRSLGSYSNEHGHLLLPILAPSITLYEWTHARLCPENSALDVLWLEEQIPELAFPIHQQIAMDWFMTERSSAARWPTSKQIEEASQWMQACSRN